MTTTATKLQNLSDKVYSILSEKGFSKLFNEIDFKYFRKQSKGKKDRADYIAEQFIFWNNNNLSDFADYEF